MTHLYSVRNVKHEVGSGFVSHSHFCVHVVVGV